jgi:DNA-binding LacI/PurR family transcriptional regulator
MPSATHKPLSSEDPALSPIINLLPNRFGLKYKGQIVTLERSLDSFEYPSVEVNERCWYKKLIDHLFSLGHRRIAYISASPELKIQADRFAGYQDGLQTYALEFDPQLVVKGDLTTEGGYHAGERLLTLPTPLLPSLA